LFFDVLLHQKSARTGCTSAIRTSSIAFGLHCPCTRNQKSNEKIKVMKRRIIYVGTLIDLAAIFEPDEEAESIEVTNIIKYKSYE
jgi:hypothetical protein